MFKFACKANNANKLRALLAAGLCAAAVLPMGGAAAQNAPTGMQDLSATLRTEPYAFRLADGSDLGVERGSFLVPEDRNDPNSRLITIGFVRFRSTNPHPGAPIIYLAGGPGGSGVGTARGARQPIFLALRALADVIALDQRGVGLSNQLPRCRATAAMDNDVVLNEPNLTRYYRTTLAACVRQWRAAGVAINGYTTSASADDIDDLRRALGVERVNLWGISYGTHLAFAMLRQHPNSVERVVLSSAEGLEQTVKMPADVDATFARINAYVGGDLVARMARVHAAMDAQPMRFAFTGEDGVAHQFRADSFAIRMLAGLLAKNPDGYADLAGLYAALEGGQQQAIAPILWRYFYAQPLEMGMSELMDIASGVSDARLAAATGQARHSLTGRALNFPMPQLRGAVAGLDLGDGFRREVRTNIPTLLFEGLFDVRTPLAEQERAVAGFSRLHRIRVLNGGHDLFEAHPQNAQIISDFFAGRAVDVDELTLPVAAHQP